MHYSLNEQLNLKFARLHKKKTNHFFFYTYNHFHYRILRRRGRLQKIKNK